MIFESLNDKCDELQERSTENVTNDREIIDKRDKTFWSAATGSILLRLFSYNAKLIYRSLT